MIQVLDYALVIAVAFGASLLTFFSGFGLGTLLLPVFALLMPLPLAVAATALVHLANNLFKAGLIGGHADRELVVRFGGPALLAALGGAALLGVLGGLPKLGAFDWAGLHFAPSVLGVTLGLLIIAFALIEASPRLSALTVPPRFLPLGGLLAGFFGGLSGHQGALRSMFLVRAGLDREAFIATGVLIAIGVDVARLLVYGRGQLDGFAAISPYLGVVLAACLAAFAGAWLGSRWLSKVTLKGIQRVVAVGLLLIGAALAAGLI